MREIKRKDNKLQNYQTKFDEKKTKGSTLRALGSPKRLLWEVLGLEEGVYESYLFPPHDHENSWT